MRAILPSRRIVNMFGAIGYSLLLASYAIVAGVVMLWLVNSGHLGAIEAPPESVMPPAAELPEAADSVGEIIFEIIAYVITAIIALTVLFVVVTLPYWLGKSGSYLLKRAIRLCQWPVTGLSLFIGKAIACGLVAVPIMMLIIQDAYAAVLLASVSILIGMSLVIFVVQHYLARATQLEAKEIW